MCSIGTYSLALRFSYVGLNFQTFGQTTFAVEVLGCDKINIDAPQIADQFYAIGDPSSFINFNEFQYVDANTCDLSWDYTASLSDGSPLPPEIVVFFPFQRAFRIFAEN